MMSHMSHRDWLIVRLFDCNHILFAVFHNLVRLVGCWLRSSRTEDEEMLVCWFVG